jgi:hypothetical protein
MRFKDYRGYTQTPVASTTMIFTGNTLPWRGVIAWIIELVRGTGGSPNLDVSYINRVKFKVGGSLEVDAALAHIRTRNECILPSQRPGTTTGYRLVIPALNPDNILRGLDPDASQFLPGEPQLELDLGAFTAASAGDQVRIGWIRTDVPAAAYSRYMGQTINQAASASNQAKPISDRGLFTGFSLDNTGMTRGRLMVNGVKAWEADTVSEQGYGDLDNAGAVTSPLYHRFKPPYLVLGGGPSEIVLDSGSGWAGITNEVTIGTEIPAAPAGK